MGLLDIFRTNSKRNLPDKIKSTFNFLLTDFGFKIVGAEELNRYKYKGDYLITYRNDQSKLQLEICASETWFHCEIRRLLNGHPAKYSDKENCIGFEKLAIIESNNKYEHMDYFAGGSNGLKNVLKNTSNLFHRNKTFFTTDSWLDTKRIEQLQDEEFQTKFGFKPSDNKNKPTYFGELKKEATKFLITHGFKLISDSDEFSPFDKNGMVTNIIFNEGNKKIKLTQQDWRDEYYLYNIELNGKVIFVMNIREHQDINEAVQLTMEKLKQCI
jgi:hypothetical protein